MRIVNIKNSLKKILPGILLKVMKDIIQPSSNEYKWVTYTKKILSGKIRKEIIITTAGDIYLKSDLGFEFLINENEKNLKINTFDDLNFKFLLEYLSDKLPERAKFLDIGAFMGGYSLAMARRFPKGNVYSFEPVSSSFQYFIKNIIRNRFEKIIFPFQLAISDKAGTVIMTSKQSTGNHILSENEKDLFTEKIPGIDLDTFLMQHEIEKVHFIKCDVEGHEMSVINGAMNLLHHQKPILYIEIVKEWTKRYENSPQDIINKLISLGYKGYELNQNSIKGIVDFKIAINECENFLFIAQ